MCFHANWWLSSPQGRHVIKFLLSICYALCNLCIAVLPILYLSLFSFVIFVLSCYVYACLAPVRTIKKKGVKVLVCVYTLVESYFYRAIKLILINVGLVSNRGRKRSLWKRKSSASDSFVWKHTSPLEASPPSSHYWLMQSHGSIALQEIIPCLFEWEL